MTEEEKEAIELLKQEPDFSLSYYKREYAIDIVLKLVDKQRKELEEYKKDKRDNMSVVYGGRRFETEGMVVKDYISKDKIKSLLRQVNASIGHFKSTDSNNIVTRIKDRLEELLGE